MRQAYYYSSFAKSAAYNMAFDEWLFIRACLEPGSAFIRLYCWKPGAISIGFNQKPETAVRLEKLGDTEIIRRVTGGRALYHDESELTYAVAASRVDNISDWLRGSLSETTKTIATAITSFLDRIGKETKLARQSSLIDRQSLRGQKAACFDSVARHEIVSDGRKIVASAQRRTDRGFLQHGSIKINGVSPHSALGNEPDAGPRENPSRALTADEFDHYAGLFAETVGTSLKLETVRGELNSRQVSELDLAVEKVKKNCLESRLIF